MRDDGNIIVLDIETRPDPAIAEDAVWWAKQLEGIEAPSNYKDPLKKEAYMAEKLEERRGKMALSSKTGIVVCIGWQYWEEETATVLETKSVDRNGEKDLLARFASILRAGDPSLFVGWCVRRFDLPFLIARAIIAGVEITRLPMPRNWNRVVDLSQDLDIDGTLSEWQYLMGGGFKEHDGDELAGLSIPELALHCADDVHDAAEMARRTRFVWGSR